MTESDVPEARRARILAMAQARGSVRIHALADALGVSPVTIRRDIDELARRGLLDKAYGGAVASTVGLRDQRGPRRTIVLLVPSLEYYWAPIIAAAQSEATARGARFIVREWGMSRPSDAMEATKRARPDGLLLAPSFGASERAEVDDWLTENAIPTVLVERPMTPLLTDVQSVQTDFVRSTGAVVRYLAGLGHERMILLSHTYATRYHEVELGWNQVRDELQLPRLPMITAVDINEPDRRASTQRLLQDLAHHRPSALYVAADAYALMLVSVCQDARMRIPEDLSVVSFGDYMATWAKPPLTAMRPPYSIVGRSAVAALIRRLNQPDTPNQHLLVEGRLVLRDSTAPRRRFVLP